MKKEVFVKKLYQVLTEENLEIYKDFFENTKIDKLTDEKWKTAISLYDKISIEEKDALFYIFKQIIINTTSNIFALLDGVSYLDGQDDEFELSFVKTKEKINGDLQDILLKYDEINS
ncbi:hypothetical protein [Haloplasma contractile]|uniref:Uncharacterized protein n=1 Tax=Haloplasma contractile SSD-17B TaxID=1033810 RepID=U2DR69_9MOLU|nr:hypothetical protein [Haloplasma contractile]ERJ11067.1 hypothetical protein HLPCO_002888 [Haloplasma contractile SSD-17B]